MKNIKWGMIGCGDVTELKSGPAFNKVPNSSLHAVMSRSEGKAKDYAERHGVPNYYGGVDQLLNDPEVNAIYIATPPSTHKLFSLKALHNKLPVYVEKPMCMNTSEARDLVTAVEAGTTKFSVAHYRRGQPKFLKAKSLLTENVIGKVKSVTLQLSRIPLNATDLEVSKTAWRIDPAIAGGGLFHDLAPHQLDLMLFFFGEALQVSGTALNQNLLYTVPDIIEANIVFNQDIDFRGLWNFFDVEDEDKIMITGERGSIEFSAFGKNELIITKEDKMEILSFDHLLHVQQPMIELVVKYFLGDGPNPCSVQEAAIVTDWMDRITN